MCVLVGQTESETRWYHDAIGVQAVSEPLRTFLRVTFRKRCSCSPTAILAVSGGQEDGGQHKEWNAERFHDAAGAVLASGF